ncbi:MAG: hypothetical protein ACI9TH_001973 [Kiritimatiellia bacterium]|jgi:hypothetical protein
MIQQQPTTTTTPLRASLHGTLLLLSLLAVLPTLVGGAESSALTREVIPVNPEADAQFTFTELTDLPGFITFLRDAEPGTPAQHFYRLFNPALKAELMRWSLESDFSEALNMEIVKMLNQIVRRSDLYDASFWTDSPVSPALHGRFATEFSRLGPVDRSRLNRQLLHQAFPDFVAAPRTPSFPERPERIHLLGDAFLGSGDLQKGMTLPTGATWQPSLFAFGNLRVAGQHFDSGNGEPINELVARLDVTLNLALTPTERVVASFRPLDDGTAFTHYDENTGTELELDLEPDALFLEGDFGELFPFIDPQDRGSMDLGFAVGRQPIRFQRGLLVDDNLDAIGIVKNNMMLPGTSNIRMTGLFAWNEINRNGGVEDDNAMLFGLFSAVDFARTSMELDAALITSDTVTEDDRISGGDSLHFGLGFIQRVGLYNTSFRINASMADEETDSVGKGVLLFADASYTPAHSVDMVYVTVFWAIDAYSAAARRPTAQGPLGPAGILFEGPGIGSGGSVLSNLANDTAGGVMGRQWFFNETRTQLIGELGVRADLGSAGDHAGGAGLRLQHAMGQHWILRGDVAGAALSESEPHFYTGLSLSYQF